MLSDILPLPEVELCDAQHRPPVGFPKQRADVPLGARLSLLAARLHVTSVPLRGRL